MKLSIFHLFDRGRGESVDVVRRGLELCGAADDLGFETFWVAEHHFGDHGGMPNPAVFLAAAAMRTYRVRLGPAVAILPMRHPVIIAEDYGLVDRLSGGRLVMGVGSGAVEAEFAAFGLDPSNKQREFEQRLAVLREIWSSGGIDPTPQLGDSDTRRVNVRPAQHPAPPVYQATNRADAAYRAGRAGLGLLTLASAALESLDPIGVRAAEHRRGVREGGHDPQRLGVAVTLMACVGESPALARRRGHPPLADFAELHGIPVPRGGSLYDRMRERGTAAFGTPDEAARIIDRLASMGVEETVLWNCFGDMPAGTAIQSMRSLTERVSTAPPRSR